MMVRESAVYTSVYTRVQYWHCLPTQFKHNLPLYF